MIIYNMMQAFPGSTDSSLFNYGTGVRWGHYGESKFYMEIYGEIFKIFFSRKADRG